MERMFKYWQSRGDFRELELCVTAKIECAEDELEVYTLDRLFTMYNADDRSDGKVRRSMSVGDVVSLDGKAFQCASMSWLEL
jgi:hypothetical protein